MGYNPEAKMSAGAIDFESKDPFYCFPDPSARDVNCKRSRYFIYAEPVDIDTLKRKHPKCKDYIKPDVLDLMGGDKTDLDQVRFKSPTDNKTILEGTSAYEAGAKNQALEITCYLKSDEFIEEEKKSVGSDGAETSVFEQRLKYPNGRKIVLAGGVLAFDGPNEYEDGLFPYARLVNYVLPHEFHGMSEVEQLQGPQKIFNKLVSFSLDVLVLMGNPIWKVGTGSGVDVDNLFNRPGLVVEADDINQVQREEGVQLQPFVLQLIDRMANWFDGISGANDVTRGVRPEGVTAMGAITALQEAAQTRIRQKSRNVDAYLQNVGQMYKNRVFQFYSAPRIFRLTNNQGAAKYFKMHIDKVEQPDGSVQKKATVRDFAQDPVSGQWTESIDAREYVLKGDFDVRVATGSSLPFAKTEKVSLAFKLAEAGAIDAPELLKAVEYPNAEAVWEGVQQRKAAMAPPPAPGQPAPPPAH
jgi:hypothetical protein